MMNQKNEIVCLAAGSVLMIFGIAIAAIAVGVLSATAVTVGVLLSQFACLPFAVVLFDAPYAVDSVRKPREQMERNRYRY